MSTNRRDTFMERASLFASPVASSSSVPKKKVARERALPPRQVFTDEAQEAIQLPTQSTFFSHPTMTHETQESTVQEESEQPEEEPMEVDTSTSMMPSPARTPRAQRLPSLPESLPDSLQLSPDAEPTLENIPCTKSTTPRRKSMPTPGKKLGFSSREIEKDDKIDKANDTSLLELLVANNPEEIPKNVMATVTDKKEMTHYFDDLKKETEEMKAIQKSREALLQKAKETAATRTLPSTVATQQATFDLTVHKEETAEERVKRLHASFSTNTQDAGVQLIAKKKEEAAEREASVLQSKMRRIKEIEERHANLQKHLLEEYKKEQEALKEIDRKIDAAYSLVDQLQPIDFF